MKNHYLLLLLSIAFELLQEASVFSEMDVRNVYHPFCIHEGDEWKIAFKNTYRALGVLDDALWVDQPSCCLPGPG